MRLGSSWPVIGLASRVPETTGSEASLQKLDQWLNRCRQQHGICQRKTRYTPRRILDLGDPHHPPNVRLREPSPGEELEYLCLSYRWSKTSGLQTLKSNVDDHKLAIPWDRLPLGFQHVCTVARRLRLRHVWIDALCIIQDDEDDKVLDIAVMDSIFEAGVLTIVSAWASGPEQGLFSHLGDRSHHEFPATTKDGVSQTVCVRWQLPHFENGKLPCLNRGWIYQELCLSPRLAFFLDSEIVWHCQEHMECQCSPHKSVHDWVPGGHSAPEIQAHLSATPGSFQNQPALSPSDAAAHWWSHIEAYSSCQLTNPSDKLPAIQGLAARMVSALRLGSYIAGAWEDSLLTDLAWARVHGGTRPATWRAPTWSWASIDGQVRNEGRYHDWTPLATATVRASEPRGVTPKSPGVRITLDCYIRQAWLYMEDTRGHLTESYGKGHRLFFEESDPEGQSRGFSADSDIGAEGMTDNSLWCAKILRFEEYDEVEEIWLVLQRLRGGEYERVGRVYNGAPSGFVEVKDGWKRETIHLI